MMNLDATNTGSNACLSKPNEYPSELLIKLKDDKTK